MFIATLTLLSALSISGVAIFYSVIGLATIFPGAFWPVVIMGSVLEVGKLVTASWLYRHWSHTRWLLKTYLTTAVIILSLITSMGIFGFLSKAHLEQNLAEDTVTQRIEIINNKILSEETYIKRQKDTIVRLESTLNRTTDSNTGALDIEIQSLKDAENKFKTLLAVETNTVNDLNGQLKTTLKDLNDRLRTLDKDVSDVLTSNKSFFNEEKAAADLKASQKEEREQIANNIAEAEKTIAIKIAEAQARIQILKDDYAKDTSKIQARIDSLRKNNVADNSGVNNDIVRAEKNIIDAQNRIDGYIVEREPLQSSMLKLEAEVGPVKYIAALAVDFGITDKVDTSEAVRWVILIIIVVFDPLAVLLLIAANQSFLRRFPVKAPKPQEIVDLEKPDEEDVTLKWNEMIDKAKEQAAKENAEKQLKEWQDKLESFNKKVPQPEDKPVEIIQEQDDSTVPHIELKGQKKTEDKEIVVDNIKDGFDPDEVMFDMLTEPPVDKEKQLEEFKKREAEEKAELERIAKEAKQEDEKTVHELLVEGFEEQQKKEAEEEQRIKPDLTEVIEPDVSIEPKSKNKTGRILGINTLIVNKKGKVVQPPKPQEPELPSPAEMTDDERKKMLDVFHNQNGKFEDITNEELKMERDQSNRAQYLADVSLTKEEAQNQPAITESRMAFFQDIIDDILRGDTTFENVPEENRKIIAQIMDPDMPNPPVITKGSALKEKRPEGLEEMSAEGLKEKFMIQPDIEDRPMTDEELDALLEGFEDGQKPPPGQKTKLIIKDGKRIFVPIEDEPYIQNEEQNDQTLWQKSKELDIPEPEKNDIILPDLPNTITNEDIPEIAETVHIEESIPQTRFDKYKKRLTSEENYHQRVEARIDDLITKLDNKEIKLSDLSEEDRNVIIGILNQES
tara:strand:+ start:33 stop:2744 length:2712 start_codon:yes stop_codon:yes gene_type:complete